MKNDKKRIAFYFWIILIILGLTLGFLGVIMALK